MSESIARRLSVKSIADFEPLPSTFKIPITSVIYFCYFVFGLSASIVGPALFDIADETKSLFKDVSYGFVGRNAAYCIGALTCSYVFLKINRQIVVIVALVISGFAILAVPFVRNLYLYLVSEITYGFFTAIIDVASNAWILEIWNKGSNPYMQGLHFCYSIGMTIAPLMTAPFLSTHPHIEAADIDTRNEGENQTIIKESRIQIPYSIGAALLFASAIALLFLYTKIPYQDPKRAPEATCNNNKGSQELNLIQEKADKNYSYAVIALISLLLCFYSGVGLTTITFFPKFLVSTKLKISKSQAAIMSSVLAGAYALARGLSIFLATTLKPKAMIYGPLVVISIGNLLLLFFANSSQPVLWVATVLLGVGHSCVIPSIYSMCEEKISVSNIACSCFVLSLSISPMITPAILNAFIDTNALVLVYMNGFGLFSCFICLAILRVIDVRRLRKDASVVSLSPLC